AVRARRDRTGGADRLPVLDPGAFPDPDVQQVAVQREVLAAVVDDDEIPETGKRSRKRDGAVVNGEGAGALEPGNLDPVGRRAAAVPARDRSVHRPLQDAPKRPERELGLGGW